MPSQDEVPETQEAEASDGCDEHTGEGEHPRKAGGGRREEIRGLGDGHDSRERSEKCDTDPVRAEQELPDNGEASARHGSREGRGCRHQAALSVQEERSDDNHGQRVRVPFPQENNGGSESHGLLRGQLRLLAEGQY